MVKIFFTGEEESPYAVIASLIREAKRRIWVEMFLLKHDEIIELLKNAGRRSVEVKILLDGNILNAGIWSLNVKAKKIDWGEIRFGNPDLFWDYHLKMAIIDDVVLFGSGNWSFSGLVKNREGLILIDEPAIVRKCEKIFTFDWMNAKKEIIREKRLTLEGLRLRMLGRELEKFLELIREKSF